jgi:hypothetical protein
LRGSSWTLSNTSGEPVRLVIAGLVEVDTDMGESPMPGSDSTPFVAKALSVTILTRSKLIHRRLLTEAQ